MLFVVLNCLKNKINFNTFNTYYIIKENLKYKL